MLMFPTINLSDAERRARQILQHGVECNDKQLLSELWCALRNAETVQGTDDQRKRLRRLRDEVGDAIAGIEVQSMGEDGAVTGQRLGTSASSVRRRTELDRTRQRKSLMAE